MSRPIELPDDVYGALVEAARASGISPADWIAARVCRQAIMSPPSAEARRAALEAMRRHVFSLGHATGLDNEQIDADLAREYGNTHQHRDTEGAGR